MTAFQHLNIPTANFLDRLDDAAGAKQYSACFYVYRITVTPKGLIGLIRNSELGRLEREFIQCVYPCD